MVNPFTARKAENNWVAPVSVVALVVGFLIALAWIQEGQRTTRLSKLTDDQRQRYSAQYLDLTDETVNLTKQNEILRVDMTKLREENTKLQNALAANSNASAPLNKSLQETKLFAALTEVSGPGVAVLLRDVHPKTADEIAAPAQIIHDTDVLRVVNELKNAGAEAISVNNRRVGPMTNYRCVGTTIMVDEVKIASPVTIRAIGDPDTLFGAIMLPGGVVEELRGVDPRMVEVQPVQKMKLPAFSGTTSFKFAKVLEDKP